MSFWLIMALVVLALTAVGVAVFFVTRSPAPPSAPKHSLSASEVENIRKLKAKLDRRRRTLRPPEGD